MCIPKHVILCLKSVLTEREREAQTYDLRTDVLAKNVDVVFELCGHRINGAVLGDSTLHFDI